MYIGNELHVDPDGSINTSSVQDLSLLVTVGDERVPSDVVVL